MVTNGLLSLSVSDLVALKEALRSGRIAEPFLPTLIERIVPRTVSADVSAALQGMIAAGANLEGLIAALELLAAARAQQPSVDEVIELVTTGPAAGTVTNRDTRVAFRSYFGMLRAASSSPGMSFIKRSRYFAHWLIGWASSRCRRYACS
jgi:hypothetical protein